jgi:hypothetical protein
MLDGESRSPSPPTLPHLADPPPPMTAPYPQPISPTQSYAAFVMDKSITRTFRSNLLDEQEKGTSNLIENQAKLRRALGRLFHVMNYAANKQEQVVTKREEDDEDEEEMDDREKRVARAPDLTPPIHKLFLCSVEGAGFEPSHFSSNGSQHGNLDKAMVSLRELAEDDREYIERLQEIRERLGETRAHKEGIWEMARHRAIGELQETAMTGA